MKTVLAMAMLCLALMERSVTAADPISETPQSPFADVRIKRWSADFLAKRSGDLLKSVEEDLRSDSPHPFAPHVWMSMHSFMGDSKTAVGSLADATVVKGLGALPQIWLANDSNDSSVLIQFPPAAATQLTRPWELYLLSARASAIGDLDAMLRYLTRAAMITQGRSFYPAWNLVWLANQTKNLNEKVLAAVADGSGLEATPAGRFVRTLALGRRNGFLDRLAAADRFLTEVPGDSDALQYRALQLSNLERYAEAARAYADADAAYPFVGTWRSQAVELVRSSSLDDARRLVMTRRPFEKKDKDGPAAADILWAETLLTAGELGAARQVTEGALRQWPADRQVFSGLAKLESTSGRFVAAIDPASQAVRLEPSIELNQRQRITAMQQAGRLDDAWAAWQQAMNSVAHPSFSLFHNGIEVLERMQRWDEEIALCERFKSTFPAAIDTYVEKSRAFALNSVGRTDDALDVLRNLCRNGYFDAWAFARLSEWQAKQNDAKSADREMAALREQFPLEKTLWDEAARRLAGEPLSARINLWRQAIRANPGARWAYRSLLDLETESGMWDEAQKLAEEELDACKSGSLSDRAEAAFDYAIVPVLKLRSRPLTSEQLKDALNRFERYKNIGAYTAAYHQYRAEILEALGDKANAAQEFYRSAKLRADDHHLAWTLVTKYSTELGLARTFAHFDRVVERDPYNGNKLKNLVQLHTMWGGSPLIGLLWKR
jgi:tetratricopeptide (TPR) repeat protein